MQGCLLYTSGYEKSDDDKHKLVIDIYAAGIVKEIFRLKLHGMSQDAIATQLNNERCV